MMKKNIYMVDLTHTSKLGFGSDTMPLQLGLIGSYCLKKYGDKVNIKIMKFLNELEAAVKKQPPYIIAASNYLWNIDLSYKSISLIKKEYPETIIIFGGPNYPTVFEEQIKWLECYPDIDFYIYRDGEVVFSDLVGFLIENDDVIAAKRAKLPSCHAIIDGNPFLGNLAPRLEDLSLVPSPYTSGLMDKFFDHKLIPAILTSRGCPFTCTFCAEGERYYARVYKTSFERKKADVDYIADKIKYTKTLRIADSNFGMYEEDVKFCEYIGELQKETGYPEYITCSTGKNKKERVLKCNELVNGIMRFTASVQSLDPVVLKNAKRQNISIGSIMDISEQVSDTDTHSYSEIILALPGDTLEAEKKSFQGLIDAGISNVTQHQLSLIYGTELESTKSRKKYGIKGMFRPIQRCIGSYSLNGKNFSSVESEEICVSTNTLSLEDYLEARRLYLTVGLFFNDRIFGEIHSLLRLLHLSTWEWIFLIHNNIQSFDGEIKEIYSDFTRETMNELYETRKKMLSGVNLMIDKYIEGNSGGNLIYKYRALGIIKSFLKIQNIAFKYLRLILDDKLIQCNDIVNDLEKLSFYRKSNIFDTNYEVVETFKYDIVKMIQDVSLSRRSNSLEDIKYNIKVRIAHTKDQRETINRQLNLYGSSLGGLTMMLSRFPIKRFYLKAVII